MTDARITTFLRLQNSNNNEKRVEFLRHHGVLPNAAVCPKCDNPCVAQIVFIYS